MNPFFMIPIIVFLNNEFQIKDIIFYSISDFISKIEHDECSRI